MVAAVCALRCACKRHAVRHAAPTQARARAHVQVMRLAMREIKLLKASQHPNVVQLIEAFRSKSGRVYIVMVRGGTRTRAAAMAGFYPAGAAPRTLGPMPMRARTRAQEYVERTLTQDLRKYDRGFPPVLAKMVAWQLLQAVSFLHKKKVRGRAHRGLGAHGRVHGRQRGRPLQWPEGLAPWACTPAAVRDASAVQPTGHPPGLEARQHPAVL